MSEIWKTYKLSEIARLRKQNIAPNKFDNQNYIGLEHIGQGNFLLESIGIATDATSNKSIFLSGDILYGKIRPYFKKAYRPKFDGICSTDILVIRSKNEDLIIQEYLYQIVKTQEFTDKATETSTGTKMPRADWSSLGAYEIRIPALPEQRSVASILTAIDDKIELNLQMNKTLEEMAMTLYKHWFVDFGPFKDSEFVDSELGRIPKGWEVKKLGYLISNKRANITARSIVDGDIYIGLEHIDKGSLSIMKNGNGNDVSSNKFAFLKGDILFGKLRPYFKKVGIAPFDGICSTDILVIVPKYHVDYGYVLFTIFNDRFIDYATTVSGGTRMPRVNWSDIEDYKIVVQKSNQMSKEFNLIIESFTAQLLTNVAENQTLTTLRDTLLPKLISGEVRVKEAEKKLEETL